jgi:hypothetical protein
MRAKNFSNYVALVITIVIITASIFLNSFSLKPNSAHATVGCPIESAADRTIIVFEEQLLIADSSNSNAHRTEYATTSIQPGTYKITLASYDDHTQKPDQNQPNESWFLHIKDSSRHAFVTTKAISDLPDDSDSLVEVVENSLEINQQIHYIMGQHAAHPSSEPNTVRAVCAAFDLLSAPEESPAPTPSATPSISPTATVSPTSTPTTSPTPSPSSSPSVAPNPSPTQTATPTPSAPVTPSPTATPPLTNSAPVLEAPDFINVYQGSVEGFTATATDADGDEITISSTALIDGTGATFCKTN